MPTSKQFKRNFKIGQLVVTASSTLPMRIIKYEDKISEQEGVRLVSVTWQEKKAYKIARYNEDDLIPFSALLKKP